MNFDNLDLAFNESTINTIEIKDDSINAVLDFISKNEEGEFPADNRYRIIFPNYGRIACRVRLGEWDNDRAEVLLLDSTQLYNYLSKLKLDSMYGWEFFNLGEKEFKKWSGKLSLDKQHSDDWKKMYTLDLFGEQFVNEVVTVEIRIWFNEIEVEQFDSKRLSVEDFCLRCKQGWDQVYKTGIETQDHQSRNAK